MHREAFENGAHHNHTAALHVMMGSCGLSKKIDK